MHNFREAFFNQLMKCLLLISVQEIDMPISLNAIRIPLTDKDTHYTPCCIISQQSNITMIHKRMSIAFMEPCHQEAKHLLPMGNGIFWRILLL